MNTLRGDATGKEPLWSKILSGGLSGGIGSAISNPFDLLKARMQANAGKAPPGMMATAAEIVREGGILGLWKGTSTTVRPTHTHTYAPTPL